ncbi:hypothetical protein RN22_03620 [Grimontia sp. AD028]|uniref:hypothetical protein n=1 Tax=Grimontia sp. AD028 TaxID=1581149 RepID=UPI00061AECC5|nr:hypothetical protein [Grimontia sp. AD028]KKD61718.1 hypothetical protein RN22_03620 [Grimontia sp. AD028]
MSVMGLIKLISVFSVTLVLGCANIPKDSVTLNQEVSFGITNIHESNLKLVNQYFNQKKLQVDADRDAAVSKLFGIIANEVAKPNSKPLGVNELYQIKDQTDAIYIRSQKSKNELDLLRQAVIDELTREYNLLIEANSTITGLLQSAVDVDEAKNDALLKTQQLTNGKVNLIELDEKIDEYLIKAGTVSEDGQSLLESIYEKLN